MSSEYIMHERKLYLGNDLPREAAEEHFLQCTFISVDLIQFDWEDAFFKNCFFLNCEMPYKFIKKTERLSRDYPNTFMYCHEEKPTESKDNDITK